MTSYQTQHGIKSVSVKGCTQQTTHDGIQFYCVHIDILDINDRLSSIGFISDAPIELTLPVQQEVTA